MTMAWLSFLLVISTFLPYVTPQFSVNVTCGVGPTYTFDVAGASDTGVIFISGSCEAVNTSSSTTTYTFDNATCTTGGGAPAIGDTFQLVIQEFYQFNLDTDYILNVTCSPNLTAVTSEVSVSTSPQSADGSQDVQITPTFTTKLLDSSDIEITAGTVGDDVTLQVEIGVGEDGIFDYNVNVLDASTSGTTVTVVTGGCSSYTTVFPHPSRQSNGLFRQPFKLFIPVNSLSDPNAPQTVTMVKFTLTLGICSKAAGGCTTPVCARRRRSAGTDEKFTNETVKLYTQILVYPPKNDDVITYDRQTESESNVVLTRAGFIGLLMGFLFILALCVIIGACVFVRSRRSYHKERDFACSNKSFEK